MNMKSLLFRYAFAVGLSEWQRCRRFSPEFRVGVTAVLGALIAPFVVLAAPAARLYWLLSGTQPRRPFGLFQPQPYVVVIPFGPARPPEIREVRETDPNITGSQGPGRSPGGTTPGRVSDRRCTGSRRSDFGEHREVGDPDLTSSAPGYSLKGGRPPVGTARATRIRS
jgi:hypothetical protein